MTTGAPGSLVGDKAAAPVVVVSDRLGAGTAPNPRLEGADLSNVILFRPRGTTGSEPEPAAPAIDTGARPAPAPASARHPAWNAALILGSALVHGSFLLLFTQPPKPLASLGVESISVELVLGGATPAGVGSTPGESAVESVESKGNQQAPAEREEATAQPQEVPVAQQDMAPREDIKTAEVETPAAAPQEQPSATANAEPDPPPEPQVQPAPAPPIVTAARDPQPEPDVTTPTPEPRPVPPPRQETAPKPERKPPPKPEVAPRPAKPVQARPEKESPVKDRGERNTRIAARTSDNPASGRDAVASASANGRGVGRSDADSNYPGQVFAHLARYKQLPANALRAGEQAKPTVAFSLDGGGRVTSVRLVRGSGNSGIDQEVQAMVRRASPFPAPPSGRAKNFSIPVTFRVN
jgi:periplasmic protein TonB